MKDPIIFNFPNGFRIVYQNPLSNLNITSINTVVKVGSIYETADTHGYSHFLEHMCFKGTYLQKDSKIIFNNFDKYGIFFNAFTNKEFTEYVIKCDESLLENTLIFLSDLLLNSTLQEKHFKKEYNVVIEENIKNEDDMNIQLSDYTEQQVYESTPYEYPIDNIKYHKSRKSFSHSKLVEYYKKYYIPENMVLSIVSNIPFLKIRKIVEKSWFIKSIRPRLPRQINNIIMNNCSSDFPKYHIDRRSNLSAIYLSLAFRTVPKGHPDEYPLFILSRILGSSFSSRLFTSLREENGLTYSSICDTVFYIGGGHIEISVILDYKKILKNSKSLGNQPLSNQSLGVLPIIIDLINDIHKKDEITKKEVDMFKGFIKGKQLLLSEDSSNISKYNGMKVILENKEEIIPFSKVYDMNYKSIEKKDIDSVIKKYLNRNNLSVSIIGRNIPSLEKIKSICEKLQ
jgi:predicted Zn-dependent peptidase